MKINKLRFLIELFDKLRLILDDTYSSVHLSDEDKINIQLQELINNLSDVIKKDIK